MIHPDTRVVVVSGDVGKGVVAARPLPRGTVIWVRDALDASWPLDEVSTWPDVYKELLHRTCLCVGGRVVQPWDHGRLMNHSCAPNCAGTEHGFELTLTDVAEGEQLTNDYALFALPDDEPFICRCGAPTCRGARPYAVTARERDANRKAFLAALAAAPGVTQALATLLPDGAFASATRASAEARA